jgi:hypothetical protein
MYTDKRTYVDFDGHERTEEFRFNLTKQELTQMHLTTVGGLDEYIKRISETQDVPKTIELFKQLMDMSYGIKTPDGRGFVKTPEVLAEYQATNAYSDLYMELVNNLEKATAFINGIAPLEPEDHKKVTPIKK